MILIALFIFVFLFYLLAISIFKHATDKLDLKPGEYYFFVFLSGFIMWFIFRLMFNQLTITQIFDHWEIVLTIILGIVTATLVKG